jgi:hypothetical protein
MNKLYTIIISNAGEISSVDILRKLGIFKREKISVKEFLDAQLIHRGIGIGRYKDKIIIVEHYRVLDFFFEEISAFEKRICSIFPESKISAFTCYSVSDIYGFSIINKCKRERTFYEIEHKILTDIGVNLSIEESNQDIGTGNLIELMLNELFGSRQVLCDILIDIYEYKFRE